MGVKDLWSVLTPYVERKPIYELRGETIAIDLAGWVCESLNTVDYFVHPRNYLKNLFFRTCYLIWEEVTPVFVLEGVPPKLKSKVIAKRNETQFRGVKPTKNSHGQTKEFSQEVRGRTRFNVVLKQCELLLHTMGIQCIQGPGEAEAYCAFLNKKYLVDGVISQDSDCFAYGALRVYRNFSVSTQGANAAQGGAVDIYDMRHIFEKTNLGQCKIIAMALLCGCDYCPEGVGGIGKDSVMKLFTIYSEEDILKSIRTWRQNDMKYNALEMRANDKAICNNCGHIGRTQNHGKNGCGVCCTTRGCNSDLWKEQRLSIKAELALRKKALADPSFPSEDIINEFLNEPAVLPNLKLKWNQPDIVKFIKQIGNLLQWPEIYCFQKFFPIFTRWQVRNAEEIKENNTTNVFVRPKEIVKNRTLKSVKCLEVIWQDENGFLEGLIPKDQLSQFEEENPKGIQKLWTTIEPISMMEKAYPNVVEDFMRTKSTKTKKTSKRKNKCKQITKVNTSKDSGRLLGNVNEFLIEKESTDNCSKVKRAKKTVPSKRKSHKLIDKYFKNKIEASINGTFLSPAKNKSKHTKMVMCSSTPVTKVLPSDLESDCENIDMSGIINGIIENNATEVRVYEHAGYKLQYESFSKNASYLLRKRFLDDMDLIEHKRKSSFPSMKDSKLANEKGTSLDDSFDIFLNRNSRYNKLVAKAEQLIQSPALLSTHNDQYKPRNGLSTSISSNYNKDFAENVSYFFDSEMGKDSQKDFFEEVMNLSFAGDSNNEPFEVV